MLKAILFAFVFAAAGAIAFALLAPLIFRGNLQNIGALALPLIVLICGGAGFVFGRRRSG